MLPGNIIAALVAAASRMAAAIVLLVAAAMPSKAASTPAASEYQVKAAYLLNFARFVEWPAMQEANEAHPLSICVAGEDPFGRALIDIVEGERVSGRRVAVQHVQEYRPGSCHVLFISRSVREPAQLLASAASGVLTVGEGDRFLEEGGIIRFVVENRRVRFDINQKAAQKSGLSISSKLFGVARTVEK